MFSLLTHTQAIISTIQNDTNELKQMILYLEKQINELQYYTTPKISKKYV